MLACVGRLLDLMAASRKGAWSVEVRPPPLRALILLASLVE
jgi:hypothetical protein